MNVATHTLDRVKVTREKQLRRVLKYSRIVRFNRLVDKSHKWFEGWDELHEVECVESALDVGLTPIIVGVNVNAGIRQVVPQAFQDLQEQEARYRKREVGADVSTITESDLDSAYQTAAIALAGKSISQSTKDDRTVFEFLYEDVRRLSKLFPDETVMELWNPDVWGFGIWRSYLKQIDPLPFELASNSLKEAWGKNVTPHGAFYYDDGNTYSVLHPPTGFEGYVCEYGVKGNFNLKARFSELHRLMSTTRTVTRIPHLAADAGYFDLWRSGQTEKLWTPAAYQKLLTSRRTEPADYVLVPYGVDPR